MNKEIKELAFQLGVIKLDVFKRGSYLRTIWLKGRESNKRNRW